MYRTYDGTYIDWDDPEELPEPASQATVDTIKEMLANFHRLPGVSDWSPRTFDELVDAGLITRGELQEILQDNDLDICDKCNRIVEPVTRMEANGLNTYCPVCRK